MPVKLIRCLRAKRLLSPYLDKELGSLSRGWLERHLGLCEDCRCRLKDLRGSLEALRSLPVLEPSAHWGAIGRFGETEPPSAWRRAFLRLREARRGLEPAWVATAVLCLLMSLAISIWSFCAPPPPLPSSAIAGQQEITEEGE